MEKALDEAVRSARKKSLAELIKRLQCEKEDLEPIRTFIQAITGHQDETKVAVVAHLIWQVKRKMLAKKVFDHLMIVLFGPQGSGKTTALKNLVSPVSDVALELTLDQAVDTEKYGPSLSKSYVCLFDEMQNARKADVDALKHLITAEQNSIRGYHTQLVDDKAQNCTFIGTSNRSLSELIYDNTGMRRYYEIKTLPLVNWTTINELDYLALWKGVDEKNDVGYLRPFQSEIAADQQSLITPDPVQLFGEEFVLKPINNNTAKVEARVVYAHFKSWAEQGGHKQIDITTFGKRLKREFAMESRPSGGKRFYEVNSDSPVAEKVEYVTPQAGGLRSVKP